MDLIDRFRYLMKMKQKSASAFAEEIGVQPSSVSHILSGRNKPSLEFIKKILIRYPKVDANWLINGSTGFKEQQLSLEDTEEQTAQADHLSTANKNATSNQREDAEEKDKKGENINQPGIQRILVFYDDHTFAEFHPQSN